MTVTNEPGYYEDGEFGIILENVLIVKEADTNFNFGDRGYLSFEYITWFIFYIYKIQVVVGGGAAEATLSVNLEFLATTLGSQERLAIAKFVESC
ncbi:Putative Xaa-Pro aminopeptidase P [Glycine soja]|uniref:Putative Xaa-Pro aminopeptidase P n=1 Tax=Glycine soja TaxID=3848 RepID=A0A0B2REV1_GLYSO|nr:Putative Xaa-Pro aminopeptidase P [Glycine soja]